MGGVVGLDYTGTEAAARALGIAWDEDTLTRLQIMEGAAAKALAERRTTEG